MLLLRRAIHFRFTYGGESEFRVKQCSIITVSFTVSAVSKVAWSGMQRQEQVQILEQAQRSGIIGSS